MFLKTRLPLTAILTLALISLACSLTSILTPAPTATPTSLPPTYTPVPPSPTPNLPRSVSVPVDGSGDYPSLAAAVADLAEGSTIILGEGEYILPETIKIDKTLTLQGAGMNLTYLTSSAPDGVLDFAGPGNLVLQGITFQYHGSQGTYVVHLIDASFDISDCRFIGGVRDLEEDIGGNGLYITGSGNGRIADSRFVLNQHNGLAVGGQVNLLVENSGFDSNGAHGVGFWTNSVGTVHNCSARNNGGAGFMAADQTQVTFEDNLATEHPDTGSFAALNSASITALRNEAS